MWEIVIARGRCDGIAEWQYGFQNPGTPIAEGIIRFHHDLMVVLVYVVVFVGWMLMRSVMKFNETKSVKADGVVHGTLIEVIWTVTPAIILGVVAVPSFSLLYAVEEIIDPEVTLKAIGRQWYWSYEYNDMGKEIAFDSYMLGEEDLAEGELRLLEVDNRVVLPVETNIRVIVTAGDVLHNWTVPGLGVKIDACPGRLNEVCMFIKREGVYYGQCSELCGVNHAFMPISVEVVSKEEYLAWLEEQNDE